MYLQPCSGSTSHHDSSPTPPLPHPQLAFLTYLPFPLTSPLRLPPLRCTGRATASASSWLHFSLFLHHPSRPLSLSPQVHREGNRQRLFFAVVLPPTTGAGLYCVMAKGPGGDDAGNLERHDPKLTARTYIRLEGEDTGLWMGLAGSGLSSARLRRMKNNLKLTARTYIWLVGEGAGLSPQ